MACWTPWCRVACAILVSPKQSIMKTLFSSVPVSRATKEGCPSNAMPAMAMDVSFCGAATTASTSPASAALMAVPQKPIDARPAAALVPPSVIDAESRRRTGEHGNPVAGPVRVADSVDRVQLGLDAAGLGMALNDTHVAHQNRVARRPHGGVERGLEADFRPDAGGIAGGDGDLGFFARHAERVHSRASRQ